MLRPIYELEKEAFSGKNAFLLNRVFHENGSSGGASGEHRYGDSDIGDRGGDEKRAARRSARHRHGAAAARYPATTR